jgi:hypothetical protein
MLGNEDRIQVYIPAKLQDVLVFSNQSGSIASLKQMSRTLVSPAKPDGIGCLQPLHELTKISSRCMNHQVDVIGHQAKQVTPDIVSLQTLCQ